MNCDVVPYLGAVVRSSGHRLP